MIDCVEMAIRKHILGIEEAVFLANRTITRQQAVLVKELEEKKIIEKATREEYERLYPEKVKKIKIEFKIE